MLATIFVAQGAAAIRNPEPLESAAKPVVDRFLPALRKVAPAAIAEKIPDDAKTLVRVNGAVQVLGGLALATGWAPRAGALALAASLVPTTWAGHAFWEEEDAGKRQAQRLQLMKNAGLMGGLLLAAVDTEGKPGLMWRARHGAREARVEARRAAKLARREARHAARLAQSETRHTVHELGREAHHAARRARSETTHTARELKAKLPH
jgi:putative oxidoreductase